jgi:hypothetical protein
MTIKTEKYARKPFDVEAIQVTDENMIEVAKWCLGDIRNTLVSNKAGDEKETQTYIKVRVRNPLNERQTKAFKGDWVLKSGNGFKVYTENAFKKSFDKELVYTEADSEAQLGGDNEEIELSTEEKLLKEIFTEQEA